MRRTLLALIALATLSAWSAPPPAGAVSCHCFKDREYAPEDPGRVDPYLLSTARNSLLAAWAGTDKGAVVGARMKGYPESDLWQGFALAKATGADMGTLVGEKESAGSWEKVLSTRGVSAVALSPGYAAALAEGAAETAAADALVDDAVVAVLGARRAAVDELRALGADNGPLILSVFLGALDGVDPEAIYRWVLNGGTWGAALHVRGVTPQEVSPRILGRKK